MVCLFVLIGSLFAFGIISMVVKVVQPLSHIQLFVTTRTAARQASLSFSISQSLLKLMSIESMMPPNHLVLFHPLLLLPSIFRSNRVFSNESALCIRWPKCWSFRFSQKNTNTCVCVCVCVCGRGGELGGGEGGGEWTDDLDSLSTCSWAPERVALNLCSVVWACVQGRRCSQQCNKGASTSDCHPCVCWGEQKGGCGQAT